MNTLTTALNIVSANGTLEAEHASSLQSSPGDLVNALHAAFGDHHARAVHAKGVILEGSFTPDKDAASITKAKHLQQESSKLIIRFSDFTGIPDIPDNIGAANPRGLALKFILPEGSTTDIVAHSFNGFPTSNSDQFRELLLSIAVSGADAAKPTALDNFLATHIIAKQFLTTQKTPASYAAISYFGVNAFKFTNSANISHFIRYQFIPAAGEQLLTQEQLGKQGANYLVDEIKKRVAATPVYFTIYAQIAAEGDRIEDPSVAWADTRKRVKLGEIKIDQLADNSAVADRRLHFIPNNVPEGIETADPMLNFRSDAYPISITARQ